MPDSDILKKDRAFMGTTHALSALAFCLAIIAWAPEFMEKIVKTNNVWVLIMFSIAAIGASLIPDLDNTTSRAKSDFGLFGTFLSSFFRSTATIIQTIFRTKRDDATPDPHRGFWHSGLAAILLGGIVWGLTQIKGSVTIPFMGEITFGTLIGIFIAFLLTHLTLSCLFKRMMDKIKKSDALGEMIALGIAVIITVVIIMQIPNRTDFWWLGVAVASGMFIHTLGDCFTTAGSTIAAPFTVFTRGKVWWRTRFLPIKAGGPFENYVFVPTFLLISIVSAIKILHLF